MALYVDDRYLNSQDSDFVNLVSCDLKEFLDSVEANDDQVLLFPLVSSYHRFLVHKTVEDFSTLCSFSIGEGDDRRTVVCLQELVLRKVLSAETATARQDSVGEKTCPVETGETCIAEDDSIVATTSANDSLQKPDCSTSFVKRVPNTESARLDVVETSTSEADVDSTSGGHQVESETADEAHGSAQFSAVQSSAEETADVLQPCADDRCCKTLIDGVVPAAADGCCGDDTSEACSPAESEQMISDCRSSNVATKDCTLSSETDLSPQLGSDNKIGAECANFLYPDLSSALLDELSLAVGAVRIVRPSVDYVSYLCQGEDGHSEEDYGRLIEIYDFPEGLITRDLLALFREFRDKHFDVKWVDKTRAIGIFSSQNIAEHVVATFHHPLVRVCPLHLASMQTKHTARKSRDFLQPYKPRPETTASTARNLVHGALGLRRPSSKEHLKDRKKTPSKSDEQRHSSSKSKRRVWDGKLRPCAMDME